MIHIPRGFPDILVVTDRFTKLVKAIQIKGGSAADVAKAFLEHWVFNFGPPSELISNNVRQFTSKFIQEVCRNLTIHNAFTTTCHSQSNAQEERLNRTILSNICSYTSTHARDWDLCTPALTYPYNCKPQKSTPVDPFALALSKPPRPIAADLLPQEYGNTARFKDNWKTCIIKEISGTRDKLKAVESRYKRSFDQQLRNEHQKLRK